MYNLYLKVTSHNIVYYGTNREHKFYTYGLFEYDC